MEKKAKSKGSLYYIGANIVALLSSFILYRVLYASSDIMTEYVKKGSEYVKIIRMDNRPAIIFSSILFIILVILFALLYRKTNFFIALSEGFNKVFSKESISSIDFTSILSLEDISPSLAIKHLYKLSILLILVKFIIAISGIFGMISFGFRYNMNLIFTTIFMSVFALVISLVILKLVFILLYNIFLLIEKNVESKDN